MTPPSPSTTNTTTTNSTELQVRQAVHSALTFWQTQAQTSTELSCKAIHPDCAILVKHADDKSTSFQSFRQAEARDRVVIPAVDAVHVTIDAVKIPPVGRQTAASVQFTIRLDDTERPNNSLAGFLVMLKEAGTTWKAISVALGPTKTGYSQGGIVSDPKIATTPVVPETFQQVTAVTWGGYCKANRLCDAALMAEYFHETCRLTYTGPDDSIHIVDQAGFLQKVAHRYEKEVPHLPFAHVKHETLLLSQGDSLLAVEFATPDVAMVTLKVGHPPFLWTDLLTCARLDDDNDADGGGKRWWIVHKSSESEPYLLDLARPHE